MELWTMILLCRLSFSCSSFKTVEKYNFLHVSVVMCQVSVLSSGLTHYTHHEVSVYNQKSLYPSNHVHDSKLYHSYHT